MDSFPGRGIIMDEIFEPTTPKPTMSFCQSEALSTTQTLLCVTYIAGICTLHAM